MTTDEADKLLDHLLPQPMIERAIAELGAAHGDAEKVKEVGHAIIVRVLGFVNQLDDAVLPTSDRRVLVKGLVEAIIARATDRLPPNGSGSPSRVAA